jgi:hypothetical protein
MAHVGRGRAPYSVTAHNVSIVLKYPSPNIRFIGEIFSQGRPEAPVEALREVLKNSSSYSNKVFYSIYKVYIVYLRILQCIQDCSLIQNMLEFLKLYKLPQPSFM